MAVISGTSFGNVFNVEDSPSLALNGAFGVETVTVGSRVFVYAAGVYDDGVSVFELSRNGALSFVQTVGDTNSTALNGASNFTSATVNGTSYLYVNGSADSGISVFQVAADGTLTLKQTILDDSVLELLGTEARMSVTVVGGNQYLIATGLSDDGISAFRINTNGTLASTSSVGDAANASFELNGAYDTATAVIGGNTFVFAAGFDDDGLTSFRLDGNGQLTFADSVPDSQSLNLSGAFGLAAATIGGTTFLFASGQYDSGISVFSVNSSGQFSSVFNLNDTSALGLYRVRGLETFQFDGQNYLSATGFEDDAVGYFLINPNGSLSPAATLFDNAAFALNGASQTAFASLGGSGFIIASGLYDGGFSVFEIGGGSDTLNGTGSADTILGRGGADILNGLAGNDLMDGGIGGDLMQGGAGDDSYAVDDIADDIVENLNEGADVVYSTVSFDLTDNLEAIVMQGSGNIGTNGNALNNHIYGNAGANYINGAGGNDYMAGGAGNDTYAVDSAGDAVVEAANAGTDTLYTTVSLTLAAEVENLVMSGSAGLAVNGNALVNVINGNAGANTVDGAGGGDTINGGGGGDSLAGGAGADTISGNAGNDFIYGGTEGDLINGGADNDTLSGNDGDDFIYGDDPGTANFGDNIDGGAGADSIFGFGGNDTLWGGAGGDSLRGGDGGDTLRGQAGNDYLYGEGGADAFLYTERGFNVDQIFDFQDGADKIQMSTSIFASYTAVRAASQQLGTDVLINAGNGDQIALKGFNLVNLTADDLTFF